MRNLFFTAVLIAAGSFNSRAALVQNFDNITALQNSDWIVTNNSSPAGTSAWFQGNAAVFPSFNGAQGSYIAANFLAAGTGGNISLWLLTPELLISNGDLVSFYTRTEMNGLAGDRMELRLSTSGNGSNVGTTSSSVGDFTALLANVNPGGGTGYPQNWTQVTATISDLSAPVQGRLALRYAVTDTSVNGNYVGIDFFSTSASAVPEPGSLLCLATGICGLTLLRRYWSRRRSKLSALIACALVLLTMRAATAQQTQKDANAASRQKARPAPKEPKAVPPSSGAVVAKDPATGALREPTAEELRELGQRNSLRTLAVPTVRQLPNGLREVQATEDQLSFSVMRKTADGKLVMECVTGKSAADAIVRAPSAPSGVLNEK